MQCWHSEQVYLDGDSFFRALEAAIENASQSIEFQIYIFESDAMGELIAERLLRAAGRGVRVRLIIDGIGSLGWRRRFARRFREARIQFRIYHEPPWERLQFGRRFWQTLDDFFRDLPRINNRNHRKAWIIDRTQAWVGSFNVSARHCDSLTNGHGWHDIGASVSGSSVSILQQAFETAWLSRPRRSWQKLKRRLSRLQTRVPPQVSSLVKLNTTRGQRRRNYRQLCRRISRSRKRVWIENSYFVPHRTLVRALSRAAVKGRDVRIIVPHRSDHFFMPWVTATFYYLLIKTGVRVYEYRPRILHAKCVLVDHLCLLGSSNLNHRSLFHDWEADVVLTSSESSALIERRFEEDLRDSSEVKLLDWQLRPRWVRLLGGLALLFRYWL